MAIRWRFGLVGINLKMESGGFGMVRWWFGMLVDCWFWMVGNGFWMIWAWFWMVSGAWLIVYWGVEVLLAFVLNCGVVTIVVGAVRHDLGEVEMKQGCCRGRFGCWKDGASPSSSLNHYLFYCPSSLFEIVLKIELDSSNDNCDAFEELSITIITRN